MDCRSDSEGKTNEGSGYDKRNIKDNPSSVATRQLPPKGKPLFVRYRDNIEPNGTVLSPVISSAVETKAGANTIFAER